MHSDSLFKIMVYNKLSWKVLWIILKYGKGAFWKSDALSANIPKPKRVAPLPTAIPPQALKNFCKGWLCRRRS